MLDLVKVRVRVTKLLLSCIYFLTFLQMFDHSKSEMRMRVIFVTLLLHWKSWCILNS